MHGNNFFSFLLAASFVDFGLAGLSWVLYKRTASGIFSQTQQLSLNSILFYNIVAL